jgi:hypothetical protein
MGQHTTAKATTTPNGQHLEFTRNDSDAPILPVAHLIELHKVDANLIPWTLAETSKEANHRRDLADRELSHRIAIDQHLAKEQIRTKNLFFLDKFVHLTYALLIAVGCIGSAYYLAMAGHQYTAGGIIGYGLGGIIVGAFNRAKSSQEQTELPPKRKKR